MGIFQVAIWQSVSWLLLNVCMLKAVILFFRFSTPVSGRPEQEITYTINANFSQICCEVLQCTTISCSFTSEYCGYYKVWAIRGLPWEAVGVNVNPIIRCRGTQMETFYSYRFSIQAPWITRSLFIYLLLLLTLYPCLSENLRTFQLGTFYVRVDDIFYPKFLKKKLVKPWLFSVITWHSPSHTTTRIHRLFKIPKRRKWKVK